MQSAGPILQPQLQVSESKSRFFAKQSSFVILQIQEHLSALNVGVAGVAAQSKSEDLLQSQEQDVGLKFGFAIF